MKAITLSKEQKEKLLKDFEKFLEKKRMSDNKINYSATVSSLFGKDIIKPAVKFTTEAYMKMIYLILNYAKEIGWHGLVRKEDNTYTVYDIITYPQVVSATTTSAEPLGAEYDNWLMAQPDEVFEHIRLQGHSHVNMGTSPSGTDTQYYARILQTLYKDDYYIFMIMNKRLEMNIWIYDYAQNVIFEKEDITTNIILEEGVTIKSWYDEAIKQIKVPEPKVTYATAKGPNIRGNNSKHQPYKRNQKNCTKDLPRTVNIGGRQMPLEEAAVYLGHTYWEDDETDQFTRYNGRRY